MSYTIKKKSKKEFLITFRFKRNTAIVSVKDCGRSTLYMNSKTDGYHWFEFFLSQEPDTDKLFEPVRWQETTLKVDKLYEKNGFLFTPEDKETHFLNYGGKRQFNEELMKELAEIIEPRFAVREDFFDDLEPTK